MRGKGVELKNKFQILSSTTEEEDEAETIFEASDFPKHDCGWSKCGVTGAKKKNHMKSMQKLKQYKFSGISEDGNTMVEEKPTQSATKAGRKAMKLAASKGVEGGAVQIAGNLNALSNAGEIAAMREACLAERDAIAKEKAEEQATTNLRRICHQKPIGALGPAPSTCASGCQCALNACGQADGAWQPLTMVVDSGAAETVIPHTMVMDHPIHDTQASLSGACYASATGDPIPNLGEQTLPLCTLEGTLRSMRFQAAPVQKPLGSVYRMCQAGHRVVFDVEGSYIMNKITGEVNWLREEDGNYMLDTYVMPMAELEAAQAAQQHGMQHSSSPFGGQP